MSQLLILAAVFLGTVGVLIGGYLFINRSRLSAADTALRRLREREGSAPTSARSIIRDLNVSDLPALDIGVRRGPARERSPASCFSVRSHEDAARPSRRDHGRP